MTDKQLLVDYEAALLGSILSGADVGDVGGIVEPRDFYQPYHELVWRAALRVNEQGSNPDAHTVRAELGDDVKRLPSGVTYLADLLVLQRQIVVNWFGASVRLWVKGRVVDLVCWRW